jgi:hypothetical protein
MRLKFSAMEAVTTIFTSTVIAAIVSASVSILVKDKEYRNDYYKKVIDKRIKAIEGVESMLALFSTATRIVQDDGIVFDFFTHHPLIAKENDVFITAVESFAQYRIWLSPESIYHSQAFVAKVSALRSNAKKSASTLDLANHFINAHSEVDELKNKLEQSIADDMSNLHEVDSFFRARRKAASKN